MVNTEVLVAKRASVGPYKKIKPLILKLELLKHPFEL